MTWKENWSLSSSSLVQEKKVRKKERERERYWRAERERGGLKKREVEGEWKFDEKKEKDGETANRGKLRSHTSITENTIPRKFDVQYSEYRRSNFSKYCTPNYNLSTPKRKIQYLETSNDNTSKTESRKFRCKVTLLEEK